MASVQRTLMRTMGALNIGVYRASKGRVMGSVRGISVLLLTVAGRKTGVERTTPVSYLEDDGRYVVTGSAGGNPTEPQWFQNLRNADRAVIEVGARRIDVAVSVADADEHRVLWAKLLAKAPFFANYQAKVDRRIPMAILTPVD